jgi:hypothetical protein
MDQMNKHCKNVQMANIRIKPSKKIDFKAKMIKEYLSPDKGK